MTKKLPLPKTKICFEGIQIKSLKKAQDFCYALNIIEEECGIGSVNITIKDIFFCPWIDMDKLNKTPMECFVRDMIRDLK